MALEILMPQHGLNMSEGLITELPVKEGDTVRADDLLFVFETDKATVELKAPEGGVVAKLFAAEGDSVPVNEMVLLLDTQPGPADAVAPKAAAPEPAQRTPTQVAASPQATSEGYVAATPYVKHLARTQGVSLSGVVGTGMNGRITAEDILSAGRPEEAAPAGPASAPPSAPASGPAGAPVFMPAQGGELKLSRIKRVTGERMSYSFREIPHIYFSATVNLERLKARRGELQKETGNKYTYSDFILAAVARASVRYPIANASFREGKLYGNPDVNVGFATATEKGLLVPVVHQIQNLSIQGIAAQRAMLVQKALSGTLDVGEMEGGTITVTNLGSYGIETFDPIVNPPEAAILAVGAIQDQVVAVNGSIRICPMLQLRLAADHRVLDGADCARYLGAVKSLLQMDEPFL